MPQTQSKKSVAEHIVVGPDQAGRRIDNYLSTYLKDIPRTRIYQMLRKGEVRVNSSRVKQDYRIMERDVIRVPPVFHDKKNRQRPRPSRGLLDKIERSQVYIDEFLLVLNKPAGIAVHSGSGEKFGVIEILRQLRPDDKYLELVHRLDKQTSGCLLIARNHKILRELHELLRHGSHIKKQYLALLKGQLNKTMQVSIPLRKNELLSGERMVRTDTSGKQALSVFRPVISRNGVSLVNVEITTGRTHQIRVHAASIGHPVAGDDKYGDREFNRSMKKEGLKRMFLHAESLTVKLPYTGKTRTFKAPLPAELEKIVDRLMNGK